MIQEGIDFTTRIIEILVTIDPKVFHKTLFFNVKRDRH